MSTKIRIILGEWYMKKILHKFGKLNHIIAKESAGISTLAGFFPQEEETGEQEMMKIGFICNAGLGSSAMGATLFRRKLQEMGIKGVEVKAYPVDQIPGDLLLAVCQKDFMEMTGAVLNTKKVYTVENLLNQSEYAAIARKIMEIMKEG